MKGPGFSDNLSIPVWNKGCRGDDVHCRRRYECQTGLDGLFKLAFYTVKGGHYSELADKWGITRMFLVSTTIKGSDMLSQQGEKNRPLVYREA